MANTKRLFLLAVSTCLLTACSTEDLDLSGHDLTIDSEYCRDSAASAVGRHGSINGETASGVRSEFERRYRACMSAKGYDLPADAE